MKKVKVTLSQGSSGKKVYLFPTPESLRMWLRATEAGEQLQVPGITELVLEPNSFIEAEMMGFEYVYEDSGVCRRLDLVRLGLAQQPKNAAGLLVTIHTGWVSGGLLPLRDYVDSEVVIVPVRPDVSSIDLSLLFDDVDD